MQGTRAYALGVFYRPFILRLCGSKTAFGVVAAALLLPAMPASANPVPAGNGIENTAEATFGKVKLIRTLMFNTAQVRANELPGSVPGGTSRTVTFGVLIDE